VLDLATSKYDMALAVVENSLGQNMNEESVVRLYDVGRIRAEEEDIDDAENDEENEDDGNILISLSLLLHFEKTSNRGSSINDKSPLSPNRHALLHYRISSTDQSR
jgi:hypothetical protein